MSIIINGHEFSTLNDAIYANGRKVEEIWVNGQQVYPDDRTTYTYLKPGSQLASEFYYAANRSYRVTRFLRATEIPAGVSTRTISLSTSRIPAYCYAVSDGNNNYTMYLYSEATYFKANPNMEQFFGSFTYCQAFPVFADFDTSEVTNLRYGFSHLNGNIDLEPISRWDVSNVTNFNHIFYYAYTSSLSKLQYWDTSSVTNMSYAFAYCRNLTALTGLGSWNLHNVTDVSYMFQQCDYVTNIDALALWDVSNVQNMAGLFQRCELLGNYTALVSWNVSSVTDLSYTFALDSYGHDEPVDISLYPLRNWNVGNVINMDHTFAFHNRFDTLHGLENWNVSSVTNMDGLFETDSSGVYHWQPTLQNVNELLLWNTSNVTNMRSMFRGQYNLTDLSGLRNWNVSRVTDMSLLFADCLMILDTTPLISWNTSSVLNMNEMFYQVGRSSQYSSSDKVDFDGLKYWNVSSVTTMVSMFNQVRFKTLTSLSNWNVGNVTSMKTMFQSSGIGSLSALANWNVSRVVSFSGTFELSSAVLEGLDHWNTSSATSMYSMFDQCRYVTSVECLANWDVSNVTHLGHMFARSGVTSFAPLQSWNTNKVTDMSYFAEQNPIVYLDGLENWDVSRVTSFFACFAECANLVDARAINSWQYQRNASFRYFLRSTPAYTTTHLLPEWNGTWNSTGGFTPA